MPLAGSTPRRTGICILNWNGGTSLAACVRHIETAREALPADLVVVDNFSCDNSIELLQEEFPNTPVLKMGSNLGYAAGNNAGAQYLLEMGCDYLVFVNPDVTLPKDSLLRLIATLDDAPNAGCAGGGPHTPEGKATAAARNRPSPAQKIIAYGSLRRIPLLRRLCNTHWLFPEDLSDGAVVYAVCGACVAFRAQAFRDMAGFDENTFLYEEEFVAAERLREKGWNVVVSPGAWYSHREASSTSKIPYRRRLHFYRSETYLLRRYYKWPGSLCFLLRIYRYLEWCAYCVHWWLTHANPPAITAASTRTKSDVRLQRQH